MCMRSFLKCSHEVLLCRENENYCEMGGKLDIYIPLLSAITMIHTILRYLPLFPVSESGATEIAYGS